MPLNTYANHAALDSAKAAWIGRKKRVRNWSAIADVFLPCFALSAVAGFGMKLEDHRADNHACRGRQCLSSMEVGRW